MTEIEQKKQSIRHRAFHKVSNLLVGTALASQLIMGGFSTANAATNDSIPNQKSKTEMFTENAAAISVTAREQQLNIVGNEKQQHALTVITNAIGKTPTGAELIQVAKDEGVQIYYDEALTHFGFYTPRNNTISLNPNKSVGTQVITLAHELTHVKQRLDRSGALGDISFEDVITVNRAREADAVANSFQVAWELKEKGVKSPWEAISNAQASYSDVANAFEQKATSNPSSVDNGEAKRAAFDQWFAEKWRLNAYDNAAVNIISNASNNEDMAESLLNPQNNATNRIEIMGRMPNGSNYLEGAGNTDWYTGRMSTENQTKLDSIKTVIEQNFGQPTSQSKQANNISISSLISRGR